METQQPFHLPLGSALTEEQIRALIEVDIATSVAQHHSDPEIQQIQKEALAHLTSIPHAGHPSSPRENGKSRAG